MVDDNSADHPVFEGVDHTALEGRALLLPSVDELKSLLSLDESALSIFLSGSLVMGWANSASDADYFIVTNGEVAVQPTAFITGFTTVPDRIPVLVFYKGTIRCDIEFWRKDQIDQLVGRCRVEEGDEPLLLPFSAADLKFLYSLSVAVPLSGRDWVHSRQRLIKESQLRFLVATDYLDTADALLEDTVGALDSGDLATATLCVHAAFEHVVDALLARTGEFLPSVKWRSQKFRRALPKNLAWEEYWNRQTMRDYAIDTAEDWVMNTLRRCRDLMIASDA